MMKMVLLLFLFVSALSTLSVSESKFDVSLKPHALDSFDIGYIQMEGAQNCSYLVEITTSCSSPKFNSNEISIAFGDANGNQVYAAKLDDALPKTFEQCASDSFQVDGPCASPICSLYLYRKSSSDDYGWKPESVKIYGYNSDVTFIFNTSIPKDTWYGYNFCDNPPPPSPSPSPSPSPPPPSPPPPSPPPPPPSPPPSSPPPPPPSPPPPPPPSPPPPPPPPSSSIQLYVQKWVLFVMVLGSVFSIWM